jgi:hypothetical protein
VVETTASSLRGIETIRDAGANRVAFSFGVPLDARLCNAIADVRKILEPLPDEAPSPITAELSFIRHADLRDSIRNDISAATRAFHEGLWKAATVLAAAATEALLLWAITTKKSKTEVEAAARSAAIPNPSADPEKWGLDAYIKVASALGLIKDNTAKQAALAKDFRNLIHPGRSARLQEVCDRGTAHSALAAVEFVARDFT